MGADGSLVLVTHFSVVLPVGLAFVSQIMCRAWAPNQNHDHTESTRDQKHIEHDLAAKPQLNFPVPSRVHEVFPGTVLAHFQSIATAPSGKDSAGGYWLLARHSWPLQ